MTEKNTGESRLIRFLRKYMPRVYFVSICVYLIYTGFVFLLERSLPSDQLVFYANTLDILIVAGIGIIVSSVLYGFVKLVHSGVMLSSGAALMLVILALLGPITGNSQKPHATLRHADHVYYLAFVYVDFSSPEFRMLECNSLGLICTSLTQYQRNFLVAINYIGIEEHVELVFDEEKNAILWLHVGEIRHTHPLE